MIPLVKFSGNIFPGLQARYCGLSRLLGLLRLSTRCKPPLAGNRLRECPYLATYKAEVDPSLDRVELVGQLQYA